MYYSMIYNSAIDLHVKADHPELGALNQMTDEEYYI